MLEEIRRNILSLQKDIFEAAVRVGRDPGEVKIVAVTKTVGTGEIKDLISLGIKDIGENRVQDAKRKYQEIGDKAIWHFIGHLQKNKVKDVVRFAELIHSVDSFELLREIDKRAFGIGKKQRILLQINLIEEGRFGFNPDEIDEAVGEALKLRSVIPEGLMTMAPFTRDEVSVRSCFATLRGIMDEIRKSRPETGFFRELSMGMSNDYLIAVEEFSTMVRIGSAIFKGVGYEH